MKRENVVMNLEYFIRFYSDMAEENFSLTSDINANGDVPRADAWVWLNDNEADALYEIVRPYGLLVHVNDGVGEYANLGETVKDRVLNFLKEIVKAKTCVA